MTLPTPDVLPLAGDFEPASRAQWLALVDKVLKGAAFERRLVSRTMDGIEIQPLYTRGGTMADPVGEQPGAAPFARGTAFRAAQAGWRIGHLHAERDPAALALTIADNATGGSDCITIAVEGPGQTGLPAEFQAFEQALAAAPLDRLQVSLMAGSHAIHAALALSTIARQRGALTSIGGLGIDPLGTLARTGELTLLRADGSGFALGVPWLPAPATTLLADARPVHEAGGSEAQELAALLSTLVAYLRAAEGEGLGPAGALPRIGLAMAVDADMFLGIAKLRAARRLVWRIADACGAGEMAGRMRLSVSTSERMMTRRDPWVNLLRTTAACTAGAMGGADEVTVLPHTWALGQPDGFARRVARNVGLVLREEAWLGRIVDPAGGAWYVERLTDDLAAKAWKLFQEWEAEGGMLAALESGLVQDRVAAVAASRAEAIATGRIELTGTSAFPLLAGDGVTVTPWPVAPLLPAAPMVRPLIARRLAEPFERLRDAADACPRRPQVFLAALGTAAEHGARSTWITNFLAAGGIGVIANEGFTNSADAGRALAESGARIACICASDQVYRELAEAVAMALKGAGAARVYLAGRPTGHLGDQRAALEAAGVDGFIAAGTDAVAMLRQLHEALGVAVA